MKADISDIDLSAPGALDAILTQLVGASKAVGNDPPWVLPRPDVNPVYLEPVPDEIVDAVEATLPGSHDGPRVKAITALVRFIHSNVLSAIIEGGEKGVSASHLYWAWQDSGYGQFGRQGDIIANLSGTGLINYDPTLETDQQVVAIGEVVDIEWVDSVSLCI